MWVRVRLGLVEKAAGSGSDRQADGAVSAAADGGGGVAAMGRRGGGIRRQAGTC